DDDKESSNSLEDNSISELPSFSAVTPTEPIDSLKSTPNHDSSINISSKIDSLFDEIGGELTLLKSFSSRINETDCHPEEEILLTKRLFESYHFDIPSPYRPPAKPPDGNAGTLNIKMMGDVSDQKDFALKSSFPLHKLGITGVTLRMRLGFVELFKECDIGDVSEEEIKEEEVVKVEELGVEYFDKFPTRDELAYHMYLLRDPSPPFFKRCPVIIGENPSNLKIPCNIRDKIICDLNKTPDLSQEPSRNYPKCGNPVDGQHFQGCALLRKKFKEDLFTYCIENGILQDSFEPSNDNTNSPPQINHHCCYGCGDTLEDIFCHQCTCKLCGKSAHYGYNCPPKVPIIPDPEPFNNQTIDELPQTLPSFDPTCYSEDGNSFTYDSCYL
nr:hypothetical protein [Tanacetum cinerariifolium]